MTQEIVRAARRALTHGMQSGAILCASLVVSTVSILQATPAAAADWPTFGQNLSNTASATQSGISPSTVTSLQPKWTFTTGGDVSARAAVVNGVAYFPDWGGNLWAVNAQTGTKIWGHKLTDYGVPPNIGGTVNSRTTPAVVDGVVYVGTQEGAYLLAINAANGNLIWKTQLESPANDFAAMITASPVVHGGTVYTGVASNQEAVAAFIQPPDFVCCTGRGSVVAVNANTGKIKWQTYMVPAGYNGGGVWGSNFVVDGGSVYVGTGNNYAHPKNTAASSIPGTSYGACIAGGGSAATCSSPDNYVDSIVSLNLGNGKVNWARSLVTWNQQPFVADGSDAWNVSCALGYPPGVGNCPTETGPDYDFGSAPNLITYQTSKGPKTILGAGQKSGIYYALDPKTGATLWQTQVGPGSSLGGMEWGSATDGKRIYVQIANLYGVFAGFGVGTWSALDPATGTILWTTADPNGSLALGPVSVADGVVYAASMSGTTVGDPTMLAMRADTGQILWTYAAGSSVNAGATIVNGVVYWGSGYAHLGIPGFTGNTKFYAFSINGN